MSLTYLSAFAGIEGFGVGFERAGMTPVARIEIHPGAQKVLSAHWPDVPLTGDIRDVSGGDFDKGIDVFVGGFPCQGISRANSYHRRELADERSGLFFEFRRLVDEYARIIDETNPRWVAIENVPDLLTSGWKPAPGITDPDPNNDDHWVKDLGADFEAVVRSLADLGYVGAWRVVNSRMVRGAGVFCPQQRRRVLVVGHRGEHPSARAVLADFAGGGQAPRADDAGRRGGEGGPSPRGRAAPDGSVRLTFRKSRRAQSTKDFSTWVDDGYANTINTFDKGMGRTTHLVVDGDRARILTPREKERLFGFPDDWTAPAGKDDVREFLLGNSIPTNVTEWLGHQLVAQPLLAAAAS